MAAAVARERRILLLMRGLRSLRRAKLGYHREHAKRPSFLTFLNTPLGLWLLSGVAVSVLSFSYTSISERRRELRAEDELRKNLAYEITVRIETARSLLRAAEDHTGRGLMQILPDTLRASLEHQPMSEEQLFKLSGIMDAPTTAIGLPQFRDRSLRSLYWQLLPLLEGSERQIVQKKLEEFAILDYVSRPGGQVDIKGGVAGTHYLRYIVERELHQLSMEDVPSLMSVAKAVAVPEASRRLDREVLEQTRRLSSDAQ